MDHDEIEHNDSLEHVKKSISKRKNDEKKRKRKHTMARVYRIILLLALIAGIVFIDQHDVSRIKEVRIDGNRVISDAEIQKTLNIKVGDRMITNMPFLVNPKAKNMIGVDSLETKIYYSQGIINIHVKESTAVGYRKNESIQVLFANGSKKDLDASSLSALAGLPVFQNFSDDILNEKLLEAFGNLDSEILLTISEVHSQPDKYDSTAMRLLMNNNYTVFTSIETLPLLKSYASIIDKADPNSRCIYLLEYGPTENQNLATVKPCE